MTDSTPGSTSGKPLPFAVHVGVGFVAPLAVMMWNIWEVHGYTTDDAYISFRYARNLVDGHGLVYNVGERIEGYTNLLWTLLIAAGMKIGIDPHPLTKGLGGLFAGATMLVTCLLSARIEPLRAVPWVCSWLLASSIVATGYAVFGLEGSLFSFLIVAGTLRFLREEDLDSSFAWSGIVFAIAGLTRPEAPLFIGILMLTLGRAIVSRRNIERGLLFAIPLVAHVLWRRRYYGEWLPTTFTAKTGDLVQQYNGGLHYVFNYIEHAGPVLSLGLFAAAIAIVTRRRDLLGVTAITGAYLAYLLLVGGDWMILFRFFQPIEPFVFILVCVSVRRIAAVADRSGYLALVLLGAYTVFHRNHILDKSQRKVMVEEKRFWDNAAGQSAAWLKRQEPGVIAMGDIGRIGYITNFPVLDLLGLVDPVIARLPGGYTNKLGRGFVDRVYEVMPRYIVVVIGGQHCDNPQMPGSRLIYNDPRFEPNYHTAHSVQLDQHVAWCVFERKH